MSIVMRDKLIEICRKFMVEGDCIDWRQITNGLINDSYWVEFRKGQKDRQFIVQRLNISVFKDPEKVMSNIERITDFIKNKYITSGMHGSRSYMTFYPTSDHKYYFLDTSDSGAESYWRISRYIENSIVVDQTNDPEIIREIGHAFGKFQADLTDFPAETLYETIPNFHFTPSRYLDFKKAIRNASHERMAAAHSTVEALLELEDKACILSIMTLEGKIPYRVTHNDAKCNNVMLDEDTKKALCVIDLDTVMPGIMMHDFGDGARYICSSTAEDSRDLDSVKIDIEKFRAFTEGFLTPLGESLTHTEKEYLAYGVFVMATELSVRFMTDYLNGDIYFKKTYSDHNLARAKCQLKLAESILENLDRMNEIVAENTKSLIAI